MRSEIGGKIQNGQKNKNLVEQNWSELLFFVTVQRAKPLIGILVLPFHINSSLKSI